MEIDDHGQGFDDVWSTIGVGFIESQLQRNPSDPQAWLMVAHARLSSGDLLGARDAIEKVIALDTRREFNRVALGGLYYSLALKAGQAGQFKFLHSAAQQSEDLGFFPSMTPKQDAALSFEKGRASFVAHDYHETVKLLKGVIRNDPLRGDAMSLLGHAYFLAGDLHPARDTYVQALRLGAMDTQIAPILDDIEYAFPVAWEKTPPQNLDPYIRAATSYVQDRWLAVALTRQDRADQDSFEGALLAQVQAQSGEICSGTREAVTLDVPVIPVPDDFTQGQIFPLGTRGANITTERYASAICTIIETFRNNKTATQARTCRLPPGTIRRLKGGLIMERVTFLPISPPHFLVRLQVKFKTQARPVTEHALAFNERGGRLHHRNSFEVVSTGRLFMVPFIGSRSYFTGDPTKKTRLRSLRHIEQHLRGAGHVYFLDHYDTRDVQANLDAIGISDSLREVMVGAFPRKGTFSFKVTVGADCLTFLEEGAHLKGIRLVQANSAEVFHAIVYAAIQGGKARRFETVTTFDAVIGKGGTREGGVQ